MNIGLIGRTSANKVDGQTISTRLLLRSLRENYGDDHVRMADLSDYTESPINSFVSVVGCLFRSDVVIIMLSSHGLKVVLPLAYIANRLSGTRLFLRAVGMGLEAQIGTVHWMRTVLAAFDGIWVQSRFTKDVLERYGLDNCRVLDNFRDYPNYSRSRVIDCINRRSGIRNVLPVRFCTFSRVSEDKGISEAITAVASVNNEEKVLATLDVYGQVEPDFDEQFRRLLEANGETVTYRGYADQREVVATLSSYDALLFPTVFPGEGFPGTLIDAFAAGLPIIATDWHCNAEIVEDGVTGLIYAPDQAGGLREAIDRFLDLKDVYHNMCLQCLERRREYTAEVVFPKMRAAIDRSYEDSER